MLAVFPAYAKEYLNITSVFVINAILGAGGLGSGIWILFIYKNLKELHRNGKYPNSSCRFGVDDILKCKC